MSKARYINNGFVLSNSELIDFLLEECSEKERERIIAWLDQLGVFGDLLE